MRRLAEESQPTENVAILRWGGRQGRDKAEDGLDQLPPHSGKATDHQVINAEEGKTGPERFAFSRDKSTTRSGDRMTAPHRRRSRDGTAGPITRPLPRHVERKQSNAEFVHAEPKVQASPGQVKVEGRTAKAVGWLVAAQP
ncbi:MAG: hypothetical protein M1823_004757 [Watsoniomyces obsoletus]|nr:MAG: hypothetical protein M1823_004757 [Watsoniomyces obsoletus]